MKKLFVIFLLFIITNSIFSQIMSPETIVQKNLDSYNNRDIENFMSYIDNEIEIYNFNDNELIIRGADECRSVYEDLFNESPRLNSKILKRIVFGDKVIDHEYITGRMGSEKPIELVLIYEIKNEKIYKITVLRK